MCILHNIVSRYQAHFFKRQHPQVWATSVLCKFCKHQDAPACYFFCTSIVSAPGRNRVSLCFALISAYLCKSSPHLLKELPTLHKSSLFTSFFCDWQRGASVSTMMQLNPPWEFNTMDAQPRTLFIIIAIIFLLCLGLEEAWKQM